MNYKILIDDNFHYMDESERTTGPTLTTREEAIAEAKKIVDESLRWERRQCQNPHNPSEIFARYRSFGEDPFIVSEDEECSFSAWEYAKERSASIAREDVSD